MNKFQEIDKIIPKGRTVDNEKQIAHILGIPYHMARRYFNRTCSECQKPLTAEEVSMFLILIGRRDRELHDNRPYLCKEHLCEYLSIPAQQYESVVQNKREEGCKYF